MVRPALAHRRILPRLKFGCKVEALQHHTAERLERAMAIKMVIGWRIQRWSNSGAKARPGGDLLFSDGESARAANTPAHQAAAAGADRRRCRSGRAPRRVARRQRDPPGAQLRGRANSSGCHGRRLRTAGRSSDDLLLTTVQPRTSGARRTSQPPRCLRPQEKQSANAASAATVPLEHRRGPTNATAGTGRRAITGQASYGAAGGVSRPARGGAARDCPDRRERLAVD